LKCWSKEPVTTKVAAGAKRQAQKEPKEEKVEDKPSKKSKMAWAKEEEKAVTAAISHTIIEVSVDEYMDKASAEQSHCFVGSCNLLSFSKLLSNEIIRL
jgi:hypothetical protein